MEEALPVSAFPEQGYTILKQITVIQTIISRPQGTAILHSITKPVRDAVLWFIPQTRCAGTADTIYRIIVWLVLFFPVGLYFMWAKTNWSKVAKIIISAFFAVNCILFTGIALSTADDLPEIKVSQTGITELEFLRTDDMELDLTSNFKSSKNSYFYVKGNDSFKIDDIEFISSNPDVAEIKYSSTALTTHVYYDITAVSPGETTVYVQTKDGIIKSEEIKVIVTGETTTESTTETSTKEETATEKQTSSQKETTTKKETSTKKVTTTQKQTSTKKETNSPNSNGTAVYRTPSGKRYHYDPDCGGKNSYKISLDDAKSSGLTPCQKCVH